MLCEYVNRYLAMLPKYVGGISCTGELLSVLYSSFQLENVELLPVYAVRCALPMLGGGGFTMHTLLST